jgi:hypothetical protein
MLGGTLLKCMENKSIMATCCQEQRYESSELILRPGEVKADVHGMGQTEATLILSRHLSSPRDRKNSMPFEKIPEMHQTYGEARDDSLPPVARTPNNDYHRQWNVPPLKLHRLVDEKSDHSSISGTPGPGSGFGGSIGSGRGVHGHMRKVTKPGDYSGGDSGHYPRNLDREYDRDHLNRGHASASTTTGYDSNMDERHGYGDHCSSADGDREYQNYPEDGFGRQSEVQDMQKMIASLQSRLSKAEALAQAHEEKMGRGQTDMEHNAKTHSMQIQTPQTTAAGGSSALTAEARAEVAENEAVLLGMRLRQLEQETNDMRMYIGHADQELNMMRGHVADIYQSNQAEAPFCAGPRRACMG